MTSLTTDIASAPIAPPVAAPRIATCPRCIQVLTGPFDEVTRCPCGWKGEIHLFTPLPITVENAQHALSEDATCMFHPTKKATAICAGTGDYICALCAVDLNGQTFSASYLDTAGKEKAGKAFDRYLERPDNTIVTMIACCFIPYVNIVFLPFAFIWMPYAIYLYIKALRQRKVNPLYARVMGKGRVIALPILMGLFSLCWVAIVIGGTYVYLHRHS